MVTLFWSDPPIVSVTYTLAASYGSCKISDQPPSEVVYTGKLNSLYQNESDWGEFTMTSLNCGYLDAFVYGPTSADAMLNTIISQKDPQVKSESSVDIMSSLTFVDGTVYLVYLMILLAFWYLMLKFDRIKKKRIKGRKKSTQENKKFISYGYDLVSILMNQLYINPRSSSQRILLVVNVLGIFWLFQYFFASFSTSLVTMKEGTKIDSLEDLVKNDKVTGVFFKEYNLWSRFKHSTLDINQKIVAKSVVMSMKELSEKSFMNSNYLSEYAVIALEPMNIFIQQTYCFRSYDNPLVHISKKKFYPTIFGILYRPGISLQVKERVDWMYSTLVEAGMWVHYVRNPQGVIHMGPEEQECHRRLRDSNKMLEDFVASIQISNLYSLLLTALIMIISSLVILTIEMIRGYSTRNMNGRRIHSEKTPLRHLSHA